MTTVTKGAAPAAGRVAVAVTWEAKEGQADAIADILSRMAQAAEGEPGTLLFWPHRSPTDARQFFLYELFADEAAYKAHQDTPHFKRLILEQALPKLARRERTPFTPFRT